MRTTLYTTGEISTIEYDPAVPCLIDTIQEFLLSSEIRTHLNKGLELLIEKKNVHGKIGWLVNTKMQSVLLLNDLKWMAEDWTLRMEKAGITHIALVKSENCISQLNIDTYLEMAKPGELIIEMFEDLQTAREWLTHSLKKD